MNKTVPQDEPGDKPVPPSPNGQQMATAGRGPGGRFAPGWKGGPGNPFAAEVGKYRARLFKAARAKDIDQALKTIREIMTRGERDSDRLTAARLLLDRLVGPVLELDIIERLSELEKLLQSKGLL